ncbi:MAG: ABC transporter substrate-binding protein [Dehalococcoidia bacterium]
MTYLGWRSGPPLIGMIALVFVAVAVVALACGEANPAPTSTPASSPFPLTLTDSSGSQVTLDEPPERIVAIDSAAVEILFALGEGHRVIGTHDFVSYPPEADQIERVGSAFALDLERIAALEPDLIYIFFDAPLPDLQKLGVPVLYLKSPDTLEEVAQQMRGWGEIVGKPGAALELVASFQGSIEAVKEKVAGVTEGPRVFHDEAPGLWTTGSGSLADEVYTLLKAENTFSDISGYAQVSPEEVVARDPEVIISVHAEGPDSFRSTPAFQNISAVKSDRLFAIEGSLLSVPGPRLVQGVELVAKLLYPDLFP